MPFCRPKSNYKTTELTQKLYLQHTLCTDKYYKMSYSEHKAQTLGLLLNLTLDRLSHHEIVLLHLIHQLGHLIDCFLTRGVLHLVILLI